MFRLGAHPAHAREMVLDDILRVRTELLVVMARNALAGAPMGRRQKRVMEKNAIHVEIECNNYINSIRRPGPVCRGVSDDHACLRLKELAVMIKAVAKGHPMNAQRTAVLQDHLEFVARWLEGAPLFPFVLSSVACAGVCPD